jgi:hypothetical protein
MTRSSTKRWGPQFGYDSRIAEGQDDLSELLRLLLAENPELRYY